MSPKVESVSDNRLIVGEGPHWDVSSQSLYLVDCFNNSILRHVPETGELFEAKLDGKVSIIIPIEGAKDKFLITINNKIVVVTWDGKSPKVSDTEILLEAETDKRENTFNDGKADSFGRLWIGSMGKWGSQEQGSLYSLVTKNSLKQHVDKITLSNGMAFDDKLKKFYYIDTQTESVESFDFDIVKGTIRRNSETLAKVKGALHLLATKWKAASHLSLVFRDNPNVRAKIIGWLACYQRNVIYEDALVILCPP